MQIREGKIIAEVVSRTEGQKIGILWQLLVGEEPLGLAGVLSWSACVDEITADGV